MNLVLAVEFVSDSARIAKDVAENTRISARHQAAPVEAASVKPAEGMAVPCPLKYDFTVVVPPPDIVTAMSISIFVPATIVPLSRFRVTCVADSEVEPVQAEPAVNCDTRVTPVAGMRTH